MHRRNAGKQNDELRARLQHAFISPDFSACPPARRPFTDSRSLPHEFSVLRHFPIGTRNVGISNNGKYYTVKSARCELMSTARSSFYPSLSLNY